MNPKPAELRTEHDLSRTELINLIDQRHALVRLGELIDWQAFANEWSPQLVSTTGRPALPTHLMASLLYLKHIDALSGEDTVERWARTRTGSISAASGTSSTTCPATHRAWCGGANASARRAANGCWHRASRPPSAAALSSAPRGQGRRAPGWRYAHARQYRRVQRETKRLRTWLGRVIRDVQRKAGECVGASKDTIDIAQRLYAQRRDSRNKLYALHAPEVECIVKGKARTP